MRLSVRPRRTEAGGDAGEDVVLRLVPRRGASLVGLSLTFFEVRAGALDQYEIMAVPADGLVASHRRHRTASVGYVLAHAEYGVLRHQAPVSFLRLDPRTDDALAVNVGQMRSGEAVRRRTAASGSQQRWLNNADEAAAHMRDLVQDARRRVWIADAHLTGARSSQFLATVVRRAVAMQMLTSAAAPQAYGGEGALVADGAVLAEALDDLRRRGYPDVEARVLHAAGQLHDRILVVDDDAWMCSLGFEQLGEAPGLIVKLPDAAAAITRLGWLIKRSLPFGEHGVSGGGSKPRGQADDA